MTQGFFYVALGEKYVNEAITSAKSVKHEMPGEKTAIITDIDLESTYFDEIIAVNSPNKDDSYIPTIHYLDRTPFDRTIFLDSDTYICDDVKELFALLYKFDMFASHAPCREQFPVDIPKSFPEINGGVLGYNSNSSFEQFLSIWRSYYSKLDTIREQPSLRKALYEDDIELYIIPPEYNCRGVGFAQEKISILHGRYKNINKAERKLNSTKQQRLYYPHYGSVKVVTPLEVGYTEQIITSIREDGLLETLNMVLKKVKNLI